MEVYPTLQPDPVTVDTLLLQQIVSTLAADPNAGPSIVSGSQNMFKPTASAIRVNAFWFASLILSLSTAFIAVLAKQWVYGLTVGLYPNPALKGRQCQFRHDGARTWKLPIIISLLPIVLHLAFLLFFAGLLDFLWAINSVIAIVATSLVSLTVLFYVGTTVLAVIYPACPFKCSEMFISFAALRTFNFACRETLSMFMATIIYIITLIPYSTRTRWFRTREIQETEPSETDLGIIASIKVIAQSVDTVSFLRWYKGFKVSWNIFISPHIFRFSEEHYINKTSAKLDRRALLWVTTWSSWLGNTESIADDLCCCPELSTSWLMFSGKTYGAAKILSGRLEGVYQSRFKELGADTRKIALRCSGALARLLTEWRADDAQYSVPKRINGVPYVDAFVSKLVSIQIPHFLRPDKAWKDTDDLHFFANILRIQLSFLYDVQGYNIMSKPIEAFWRQLREQSNVSNLGDDDLKEIVNTAVYTASRIAPTAEDDPDWDRWSCTTQSAVEALAVFMENRPSMGISVYRQISYGIWLISTMAIDSSLPPVQQRVRDALILQVANTDDLSQALGDVLSQPEHWSDKIDVLSLIVTMVECMISHPPTGDNVSDDDETDRENLVDGIVERIPDMLRNMRAKFEESGADTVPPIPNFISVLRHTFKICRARMIDTGYDIIAHIGHIKQALRLLLCLVEHLPSSRIGGDFGLHKLICGGLYELTSALLNRIVPPDSDQTRVDLFIDGHPPDVYADAISTLLGQMANTVDPQFSRIPELVFRILVELFRQYGDGATDAASDIDLVRLLTLLRDPSRQLVEHIQQTARIHASATAPILADLLSSQSHEK